MKEHKAYDAIKSPDNAVCLHGSSINHRSETFTLGEECGVFLLAYSEACTFQLEVLSTCRKSVKGDRYLTYLCLSGLLFSNLPALDWTLECTPVIRLSVSSLLVSNA